MGHWFLKYSPACPPEPRLIQIVFLKNSPCLCRPRGKFILCMRVVSTTPTYITATLLVCPIHSAHEAVVAADAVRTWDLLNTAIFAAALHSGGSSGG